MLKMIFQALYGGALIMFIHATPFTARHGHCWLESEKSQVQASVFRKTFTYFAFSDELFGVCACY